MICEAIYGLSIESGTLRTAQFAEFDYDYRGTTVPLNFISSDGYLNILDYRNTYGTERQYNLRYTLANGNKIYCKGDAYAGGYTLYFRITNSNGVQLFSSSFGTRDNYLDVHYALFLKSGDSIYIANCVKNSAGTGLEISSSSLTDISGYIGELPAQYIWLPWNQLSGNNGQYRINLTRLKISAFTSFDPGSSYQRDETYFNLISAQASIWNIFQNITTGVETKIAYSGENYMTLTVTDTLTPGVKKFTFKLYAPQSSTTTLLVTSEKTIAITGQASVIDCYLSFVYDSNEQVAVFIPIIKMYYQQGLPQYTFGNESPTEDEMLYTFLWLQASGAGTPEYPYDTGSTDNGGNPAGPKPGDHITPADVPALGAMGSGLFTVYCPTDTQLGQIAAFLWSDNLITNLKKYFNSVSENIISLYVLPYKPGTLPTKNFQVGNAQSDTITGVEYITSRFVSVDMGSVYVENEYDSYLDYSPYTKFECYLPGIGVVTLDADDIMTPTDPDTGTLINADGATLSLKYTIDLMTGILVAFIFIDDEMRYQFSGKIGYEIPLTGETYSDMVRGFITAASGLVGTVATGGLSAPLTAAGVGAAVSGTVNAMKPEIHRSGNLSGDASMMGKKTPYLIYHKPNKPLLENQALYTGFPSYKSGLLSEFEGFTQVIDAHVEGISCTEAERAEILQLLKSGVII